MATDGIPATHPTVIPAQPSKTYDRWVISELNIAGTGIGNDIAGGYFRWRQHRQLDDGTYELGPPEASVTMPVPDIFALAAQYPEVAQALDAVVAAAVKVATDRGLL